MRGSSNAENLKIYGHNKIVFFIELSRIILVKWSLEKAPENCSKNM